MPGKSLIPLLFVVLSQVASAVEIPFHFTDGFICIEARVAQSAEPLNLLLDSGAGVSVLDIRTARRLHLKLGRTQSVRGVGSEASAWELDPVRTQSSMVPLPEILLAADLSLADEICSRPVDGLIGVDFFAGRVVQIDYARCCIRLLEPGASMPSGERLPIKMQNGVMCVPVRVNDSQERWTRFDTGCNDALHWVIPRPKERATRKVVSIGFVTKPNDSTLTSVSLGTRTMNQVKTSLHGRQLFEREAGLLGNGLLSRFTVTVDMSHRQVLLADTSE